VLYLAQNYEGVGGASLCYDYKEPFNILAEMKESPAWGPLLDTFRTQIVELNKQNFIHNIQKSFQIIDLRIGLTRTLNPC